MTTETGMAAKRGRVPGSGRKPGTRNALPPMGKSFREVLRNLIGIDDESVERLKRINGSAVAARQRLWETLHGVRPATTQEFLAVMKFCADYGLGTPVKMPADVVAREPLVFVTVHQHLPWCWAADGAENGRLTEQLKRGQHICASEAPADQLLTGRAARSAEMISSKAKEEELRALEAKNPTVIEVEPEPAKAGEPEETLEIVTEPPEVFTPGGGRGR